MTGSPPAKRGSLPDISNCCGWIRKWIIISIRELEEALWHRIQTLVNHDEYSAIIFQDYDKGVITRNLIEKNISGWAISEIYPPWWILKSAISVITAMQPFLNPILRNSLKE